MKNPELEEQVELIRTTVEDERTGLKRLVWAVEVECPLCDQGFVYVYQGEGVPKYREAFLMKISPCPDCVKAFKKSEKKKPKKKAEEQ